MKASLCTIVFCFLGLLGYASTAENELEVDRVRVQQKVLEWADSAFYYHEGYRFEGFVAHYTEAFKALMLKVDRYDEKIVTLKEGNVEDGFNGVEPSYEKLLAKLERKRKKAQYLVDAYAHRARYYEISFWSSVRVFNGKLAYVLHHFRLSNHFMVLASNVKTLNAEGEPYQIVYRGVKN